MMPNMLIVSAGIITGTDVMQTMNSGIGAGWEPLFFLFFVVLSVRFPNAQELRLKCRVNHLAGGLSQQGIRRGHNAPAPSIH